MGLFYGDSRKRAIILAEVAHEDGEDYLRVLDGLINRHWLVAIRLYWFTTLCLLSGQHGFHAHHLIPKLGDDLREVIGCQIISW